MQRHSGWFLIAVILALSGCASAPKAGMQNVHVAAGRMIEVEFGPGGPAPGRADGYEVKFAAMVPGTAEKEVVYKFALSAPPGVTLQSIRVDDISEEFDKAQLLYEDPHPWLTDNLWQATSKPIPAADPRLAWVYEVTPSMRVYRFVVVDSTGKKSMLYQVAAYGEVMKMAIRHNWGEKY